MRAVGAGHAWSDVALTDGYLIEPRHLSGLLELDDGTLATARATARRGWCASRRDAPARAQRRARRHDLALPNMGGYDAQTIAGVVSTSTHGSGLGWGPFPDLVRSLDLVVAGGEVVRVEPPDGTHRPAALRRRVRRRARLIQDDDTFARRRLRHGLLGTDPLAGASRCARSSG